MSAYRWTEQQTAVSIPMTREMVDDLAAASDLYAALNDGYLVQGPTEPEKVYDLPDWDDDASPEWKALWVIADGCEYGDDECVDLALETIGVPRWKPGPKPGWRPGLREALSLRLDALGDTEEPT